MRTIFGENQYVFFSKLYSFEKLFYRDAIYAFLWKLNLEYAGFRGWYNRLFTEEGELCNNREILICKTADQIAGIAILKKDDEESKICTLRVAKNAQRKGIGKQLVAMSIEWLQTEKPLITIRSTKEEQFEKLFLYFGFERAQAYKGYYGLLGTEISYNGILPAQNGFLNRFIIADMQDFLILNIAKGNCTPMQLIERYIERYIEQYELQYAF